MVSRSAYAQLDYSPLMLAGTVAGHAAPLSRCRRWPRSRRRPCALAGPRAPGSRWPYRFQPMLRFYRRIAALGARPAGHRRALHGLHHAIGAAGLARTRRHVERARAGDGGTRMTRHGSRTRIRQGPQGRELPRRLVPDRAAPPRRRSSPSTASRAPPTTSPTTRAPRQRRSWRLLDDMRGKPAGQSARVAGRPWRCARRWHARG